MAMVMVCGSCGVSGPQYMCGKCNEVPYCNKACQVEHWKNGGHKRGCQQGRAAAIAACHAQGPVGASCFICLDDGEHRPIPLGCACRGNAGFAHPGCIEDAVVVKGLAGWRWQSCMTCHTPYTGAMRLELTVRQCDRVCSTEPQGSELRMVCLGNLASEISKDDPVKASEILRELSVTLKKTTGPEDSGTLTTCTNLGCVLTTLGRSAEAVAILEETLAIWTRVEGADHLHALHTANEYARALYSHGQRGKAMRIYNETIGVQLKVLGPEHPGTLLTANSIAVALGDQGQYAEAEAMFRKIIKVQNRTLGLEHPGTVATKKNLARILQFKNAK
jgi:tetratricopeptide (TPR) repeat protein